MQNRTFQIDLNTVHGPSQQSNYRVARREPYQEGSWRDQNETTSGAFVRGREIEPSVSGPLSDEMLVFTLGAVAVGIAVIAMFMGSQSETVVGPDSFELEAEAKRMRAREEREVLERLLSR